MRFRTIKTYNSNNNKNVSATIDNVCPGFSTKLYAVDSRNMTMNRFVWR